LAHQIQPENIMSIKLLCYTAGGIRTHQKPGDISQDDEAKLRSIFDADGRVEVLRDGTRIFPDAATTLEQLREQISASRLAKEARDAAYADGYKYGRANGRQEVYTESSYEVVGTEWGHDHDTDYKGRCQLTILRHRLGSMYIRCDSHDFCGHGLVPIANMASHTMANAIAEHHMHLVVGHEKEWEYYHPVEGSCGE
jgi:hypothetical protein